MLFRGLRVLCITKTSDNHIFIKQTMFGRQLVTEFCVTNFAEYVVVTHRALELDAI